LVSITLKYGYFTELSVYGRIFRRTVFFVANFVQQSISWIVSCPEYKRSSSKEKQPFDLKLSGYDKDLRCMVGDNFRRKIISEYFTIGGKASVTQD
jgi:hypothetical protein